MREITRRQVASRAYVCDSCTGWIKSGAVYLRFSLPPQDESTVWLVFRECSTCATRLGRAGLLESKEKQK